MRYYKTLKVFKSRNATFDPFKMEAWSYGWWQYTACLDGKVYFNAHHYSMPTGYHQRAVRHFLKLLGVKYETVYMRFGMQDIGRNDADLRQQIAELETAIAAPRSRKATNAERRKRIAGLEEKRVWWRAFGRKKPTKYKGKLNFDALPKPEPLSNEEKARRAERKAERAKLKQMRANQWEFPVAKQAATVSNGIVRTSEEVRGMLTCVKGGRT